MQSSLRFAGGLVVAMLLAQCSNVPARETTQLPAVVSVSPTASVVPAPPSPTAYVDRLAPAAAMGVARAAHSATLLPDGRVLVVGGFREEGTREVAIADAELYDPTTNTFAPTGKLNEARSGHTATALPTGEVLIVGGWGVNQRTATAELYDPRSGTFRFTGSLTAPRASMTATLLPDGRVVILGGDAARNVSALVVEVYDPLTAAFTSGGSLLTGRSAHTATLLGDGTILVAGGGAGNDRVLASAERYDPRTGLATPTADLQMVRYKHAAVRLANGDVLLIGGANQRDWTGKYTSTEVYNPQTGAWALGPPLGNERFKLADAAVLLGDGSVLVGGGNRQMERLDLQGQWQPSTRLDDDYFYTVLTPLHDGRVLITGGYDAAIQPTTKAWLYEGRG